MALRMDSAERNETSCSPDLPPNRRAPDAQLVVHRRLLGNDVLIAENLTGLAAVAGH